MQQEGFLVISDITGYTAYLTGTEQLHAEEILQDLFRILLEHTVPPLVVNKLEGDAILAYTPDNSFTEGQSIVEAVENIYIKFRQSRENMHRHTSCECDACRNIPNLDLKFFVHHGSFSLLDIGGREELSGPNVILIHRLLKNDVTIPAYSLYTRAAVEALHMEEYFEEEMEPHSERYEHLGQVEAYVQDMHKVWKHYQANNRTYIGENDPQGFGAVEVTISAPPTMIWEYVSQPKTFPKWYAGVDIARVTDMNKERTKRGTVGHCAHGNQSFTVEIVDIQPFEYVTYKSIVPMPGMGAMSMYFTYQLSETKAGTQVTTRTSEIEAQGNKMQVFMHNLLFKVMGNQMKQKMQSDFQNSLNNLHELIEKELTDGNIVLSRPNLISANEIDGAVQKFLTETDF